MGKLSFLLLIFISVYSCDWCYKAIEIDINGESLHGYYITAFVGTPPQTISLLIDTGSSNLAIAAAPPPPDGNKSYFHYNESSSFEKKGRNVDLHYVQAHWNGFLGIDNIILDTQKNKSLVIKCNIACMTTEYNVFDSNSKFSGILGLAYAAAARPDSSILPFFDIFKQAANVKDIFSINLCGPFFSNSEYFTSCGKFHLGFISSVHFHGNIVYTPVVKEHLYEITLTNLKVGSKSISSDCKELNIPRTIVDTGTTRLHLPKSIYNKTIFEIVKSVNKNLGHHFWLNETTACVPQNLFEINNFPPIILSFYHTKNSSFDLILSPELYLLSWPNNSSKDICFILGIEVSDVGTIIGSAILKGYYVVFDRLNKRVGFGNSTAWDKVSGPLSSVTYPFFSYGSNFVHCNKNSDNREESDIHAWTIILLLIALGLTLILLYMIITWIRAHFIDQSDNHSDISSLVGEN